jgi:hypothetical protein
MSRRAVVPAKAEIPETAGKRISVFAGMTGEE